jgi:signal transduction histidine kinase
MKGKAAFAILLLIALGGSAAADSGRKASTVLFISSGSSRERTFLMQQAFEDEWKKREPELLFLDYRLAAFALPVNARAYELAEDELAERLAGRDLSLIVSDHDLSTELADALKRDHFPKVPILVIGASDSARLKYASTAGLYQFGLHDFAADLIDLGFTLFPKAKRGVIVVRVGEEVAAYREYVEGLREKYADREIEVVMNPDRASVDAALRSAPAGSFVALLSPGWANERGYRLAGKELIRSIEDEYGLPVVSFIREFLGAGSVGGVGVRAGDLGSLAARTGLSLVLDGREPETWMPVQPYASTFVDYRALTRFGSSPGLIPRGAEIVNPPASLWIRFRGLITAALAALLASVAYLLLKLVERRREGLILMKANEELDLKVADRTRELSSANEALSVANESLTRMMRRVEDMQESLIRHEREVTLGRLTAGIAHELNTPLNAIRSANESLRSVALGGDAGIVPALTAMGREGRSLFLRHAPRVIAGATAAQAELPAVVAAEPLEARLAALSCANAAAIAADLADAGLGGLDDRELGEFAAEDAGAVAKALYCLSALARSTSIIDTAVSRSVEVIKAVREYLSDYRGEGGIIAIRPTIERALLLFNNRLSRSIRVETDFADDTPVKGDEAVLVRIWIHLIQNALEAMPSGGVLAISLRREGRDAMISFDDDGSGVDPSIAGALFNPFVTTKPPAEGLGLGLAYCRKIAEAMGGEICYAGKEKGSTFTVRLPIAEAQ